MMFNFYYNKMFQLKIEILNIVYVIFSDVIKTDSAGLHFKPPILSENIFKKILNI